MRTSIIASSVMALAVGFAANAAPIVSDVTMSQDTGTTLVTVKYRLSGEPGVITLDIQTNYVENAETKWASIGPANMLGFVGDVHQVVQPTTGDEYRTIYWHPETYWPGPPKVAGTARAVVTAWATNAPPDYMIVHLIPPYDVTYYPYVEMVPDGITNIKYKGEYMPFRKIPAKGVVWWAGLPSSHANYSTASKRHRVALSHDYYMAVYEMTAAQLSLCNASPGAVGTDRKPAIWYRPYKLRGTTLGRQWPTYRQNGSVDWEASHAVDEGSKLDILRRRFGMLFDLPTEHQWEYACRAGSPGSVYTDTVPTTSAADSATMNRIARYSGNKNASDCEGLTADLAVVGSYEPNVWGLYDMLGNQMEMCLDVYANWDSIYPDDTTTYVDPVGPAIGTSTKLACRGGRQDCSSAMCLISYRNESACFAYESDSSGIGTRLVVTLY